MITLALVTAWMVIGICLILGRSWTLLASFTVLSGVAQAPLISIFRSDAFQYIDDIPAALLIAVGVARLLTNRQKIDRSALAVAVIVTLIVLVALLRSPDFEVGLAQARQVLLPFGLALAGLALRDSISWQKLWNVVIFVAVFAAIWMLIEKILEQPLIDPVWYYTQSVGGSVGSLRLGLPPAYYSDLSSGILFRPGGPYLNPPVAGFILGAGAYGAMRYLAGGGRVLVVSLMSITLMLSIARAGIVILVIVTLVYFAWNRLGKFAGVLVSAGFASFAVAIFAEQGNTASHAEGLVSGVTAAVSTPLGLGFGVSGYQAALAGAEAGVGSESLLGLYFSWLGLPALLGVVAVCFSLVRHIATVDRRHSLPVWIAVATVTTAAVSESASSMASTPALWLALGLAFSGVSNSIQSPQAPLVLQASTRRMPQ